MKQKKRKLTIKEKFDNAERILKSKGQNPNAKELFEKVIKKAVKPKNKLL
jgi:hypothetical protein